ncbi:hypothetical protein ILUMI_25376 [Ignelater luminosus]|uniref:Major facilitator superfamily (MFS) profile domain-containing protein n=1 Tax=Ignelater luminosus TaxID=2038154 RepID=A0A8K0FZQ9_IGNLU|nr:hypothetical protein ILUMI_25376 [Ignelater luminosus]
MKRQEEQFNEMIVSSRSLSYYEGKKFKTLLPQILAAILAASFNIVYGISLAYSAILIPQLEEEAKNNNTDAIQVTESDNSLIASVLVIVVPIGAIVGGFIMDYMGRLNIIKLAAIPSCIGWVLIALAYNVPMLIAGRVLTGIAAAWGTGPAIVYMTEIARPDMRGSLISTAPAFVSLGTVLVYLKGWVMHWRLVAWLCIAYSIVPAFLIMLIPESPPWLVSKGRVKQAKAALEWINKYQPQPEFRTETFAEMQLASLQKEHMLKLQEQARSSGNSVKRKFKMFLQPTAYKPLLILAGLFFFQQFSGTYITLFYAVSFFEDVGTNINPYLASIFLGAVRFAMSIVNTGLMKRYMRRSLLTWSALGMAACMGISGLFTTWIRNGTTNQSWVPVLMLVIYVVTSMVGLLSIPWTIAAELFPIEIRGVSHAIVYSIANFLMFAALQSYYKLTRFFGGSAGLQYFFAVISLGGLIYSYVVLPETHRKKLSEIEEYFKTHTTYLSVKAEEKKMKSHKKPIVINPQLIQDDYLKKDDEQTEKMLQDKV